MYIFQLDLSGAFDSVYHEELFETLQKAKVDSYILGTL